MEKQIRKIMDDTLMGNSNDSMICAETITSHVMEFIEWLGKHYTYGHHGTWIGRYTDQRVRENWKSTEELFSYWLTKVKIKVI